MHTILQRFYFVSNSGKYTQAIGSMKSLDRWEHKSNNPRATSGHISPVAAHLNAPSGEFAGTLFFLWMGYSDQIVILAKPQALL